ncbi:MAG TPA: GSCFA domain-containing protein [Candidatus Limnocylindrales bacterium]|nr:GSCFA domain-containing protein [Candidatus Limnocylindrales bacterium]
MPQLHSRLGTWELENVHAWSDRALVMMAPRTVIVEPSTRVATIGSCFAAELATMMEKVGINGAMHPSGLFYSTAAIRQELERLAGGWPERAAEPAWAVDGGFIDPFRDYDTVYPDLAALETARAEADADAAATFAGAGVVVVTLGLIETWRSRATGSTLRAIPHPAVFAALDPEFHRVTVAEMVEDLERIRDVVVGRMGAQLVITVSPVPLHTTFTPLDVRIANTESKTRIRAAVSEFIDRNPDVHYFHSYEMVVTAEKQSDYFRDDGRHIERHAVRYIVSEFLRLFADPALHLGDVDVSWLTPIEKTAKEPSKRAPGPKAPRPAWRRALSRVKRTLRGGGAGQAPRGGGAG